MRVRGALRRRPRPVLNTECFERLKNMPALSHWPNRPLPWRLDQSQVVQHIKRVAGCDVESAVKLFGAARAKQVIVFDRKRLVWVGNREWVRRQPKQRRNGNKTLE